MKVFRILFVLALALGIAGFMSAPPASAQGYGMHNGMRGPGYQGNGGWSYCPYCGRPLQGRGGYGMAPGYDYRGRGGYPMGPGMMGPGYEGRGMGPGMMGPGYGRPYDYRGDRPYGQFRQQPLKKEDAKNLVADMLKQSRNPNLKVGDVKDDKGVFIVDILTKNGSLVDKIQVDKETGLMRSIY